MNINYVVYEPAYKAGLRHTQITDEAQAANMLKKPEAYRQVIYHPTQDKAAIEVVNIIPVQLSLGKYTEALNFEPFFSEMELNRKVAELPADWWPMAEPEL